VQCRDDVLKDYAKVIFNVNNQHAPNISCTSFKTFIVMKSSFLLNIPFIFVLTKIFSRH
jgi:hypothetical protein